MIVPQYPFKETQRFRQPWLIILFAVLILSFFFMTFYLEPKEAEKGISQSFEYWRLLNFLILPVMTFIFFFVLRLETIINENGISVRFFFFHLKWKNYSWEEIEKCYVRTYKPIAEYGGWGIKGKIFSDSRAFNVLGNMGLQIEFKNKKKLLIGTQKGEELEKLLKAKGHWKE